ncbi:FAD-dependent monooxygenase [Luteithermobacter gelatinilyticus]|uniref:FAD-dependent monooxygenase n=1 Tax=Luteithermobacter gelatinilyticus TaxID=2582913 RepID=UPI0011062F2E|nr:FAD-dependent monooxygenase [Luteithermobacter gelatinilyticus]
MRPAGKNPNDSLYFRYPHFPFVRPPEMEEMEKAAHELDIRHPVTIVGAGPVGLTAALELARHGVRVVVMDEKDTLNDGSRAICISRHSYETLQQLGVHEAFTAKGLGWTHGRCYYKNRMIYRLEMPHSAEDRFKPMYNLQQQYIEQFLAEKAMASPLIEMRWQNKVTDVRQDMDGVRLTVQTPEGAYELKTDWLLAADGGRSRVRETLGLKLKGEAYEGRYVIVDIQMDHDFPTERRAFFEPEGITRDAAKATILIHKQPDNIWRIDYQLQEGESEETALEEGEIRRRIQAILDMIGHRGPWALEWWSLYKAYSLCLDEYRVGRVLFIGDSAHLVPIFGVRGLNNGFSDATNAAWKLAYVVQGFAPESLLDSYTPERRGATLDVFANASKSAKFMTPPSPGYALMRRAALSLALHHDFTRQFVDPRQVQPYTYVDSPLTSFADRDAEFSAGPGRGAAVFNRRLGDNDYLLDHLGRGFSGFYFSEDGTVPGKVRALFERLAVGEESFTPIILDRRIHAPVFKAYGAAAGSFYLIRPDRHVTARWRQINPEEVLRAFHIALGERS